MVVSALENIIRKFRIQHNNLLETEREHCPCLLVRSGRERSSDVKCYTCSVPNLNIIGDMGSLFMIVVPTRDHEALLRQKQFKISIFDSQSVVRNKLLLEQGNVGRKGNVSVGSVSTVGSLGSSISDVVDVYNGVADGKTVTVVVSEDSMAVIKRQLEENANNDQKTKDNEEEKIRAVIENTFLEKHMEDCLSKFNIMNAVWGLSVDRNFSQVTFTVAADHVADSIILHLQTVGIGKKFESSICVCAASVFEDPSTATENEGRSFGDDGDENDKKSSWSDFVASIKSRLTVAQVVQTVHANAVLTFDFIMLACVAGCVAGLGLIDNSVVNVVASMLISPLMGPIMAATFGIVIGDRKLIKVGIKNEIFGLFLCVFEGFLFGIILQMEVIKGPWAGLKWPTEQMNARSQPSSLIIGVFVAIPSGVGVALSILAGNAGSLVGVAISASLLPPAVNCGILWGMSLAIAIRERLNKTDPEDYGCDDVLGSGNSYTIEHTPIYCTNTVQEYLFMGLNSFALTFINIAIIFIVGVVILKIKEVAPYTTRKSLSKFWKEDIKIVRGFNLKGKGDVTLLTDIEQTGRKKDEILKSLETEQTFAAVNRRVGGGNILGEFRRRRTLDNTDTAPPNTSSENSRRRLGLSPSGKNQRSQNEPGRPRLV